MLAVGGCWRCSRRRSPSRRCCSRSATSHGWVITTLAVSMIFANLVGLGWGPDPIAVQPPAPLSTETFELLGANVSSYQIAHHR